MAENVMICDDYSKVFKREYDTSEGKEITCVSLRVASGTKVSEVEKYIAPHAYPAGGASPILVAS